MSAAQVNFRAFNAEGFGSPAFTPVRHCAVPPAWDNQLFVTPTSRYGDILAWNVLDVERHLAEAITLMTEMDKKIPGDTPQKWRQYNLIGQAFAAAERELRSAGKWPVLRDEVYALSLAQNAVVMTARKKNTRGPCFVAAHDETDGKLLWKVDLPVEPRLGGLAVDRRGRVLVTLTDGSLLCVGTSQ